MTAIRVANVPADEFEALPLYCEPAQAALERLPILALSMIGFDNELNRLLRPAPSRYRGGRSLGSCRPTQSPPMPAVEPIRLTALFDARG